MKSFYMKIVDVLVSATRFGDLKSFFFIRQKKKKCPIVHRIPFSVRITNLKIIVRT